MVYTVDGTAPQGEGNDLEHWYATAAVTYYQGTEVRHSERLIGTQKAGNLLHNPGAANTQRLASRGEAYP
jgi:hypothetical protein